ncbi:MAG: hypothetical protein JXB88_18130 [Spirochaetales bacterium]|nr:hypothetical protein [Spirochaetales bacterium]
MATKTFQIGTYEIKLAREMTIGGGTVKFYSYIKCAGGDHTLLIYFLRPDSNNMDNIYLVDSKLGRIVVPWDQYPVYVDLLRNEKPLYVYLDSEKPINNRLYTGKEPIGEEES